MLKESLKLLLEDILKDNPAEVKEPKIAVAVETTEEKTKAAKPPLDFAQVKAS